MVFSIILILLVAGIAYFHWIQGLFTAAISMALAMLAATLAIGMHESLVVGLLGGKMADYANGIMLCLIFGAVYGIGRIVFDGFVPGNVRVPLYMDKVGGLICGLIAGIFAAGVFGIAAQAMPFGSTILGYSRYPIVEDKIVAVAGANGRQVDATITGQIDMEGAKGALPDPAKETAPILGVDQWAADFVGYQSRAGAFAGGRSFVVDHPNLLRELFFGRLGVELGAKRTALNIAGRSDVTLAALFAPTTLTQVDGELKAVRSRTLPGTINGDAKSGKVLLVARLSAAKGATDTDGRLRFSTGTIRLSANGVDHYPAGTMQYTGAGTPPLPLPTPVMMANAVDDFLVAKGPFDVVFELPRADVVVEGDNGALKVKPGVYIEVKRFGRIDLSGKDVTAAATPVAADGVERKASLMGELPKRIAEAQGTPVPK